MKTMKVLLAPLALTGVALAPQAWADTLLLSQSTLVNGNESTTDSFTVAQAGAVTVSLVNFGAGSGNSNGLNSASNSNLPSWQPLAALSFTASAGANTLATLNGTGMSSETETFNVGPGTYFANIMATAANSGMDMGFYSIRMTFSPTAPVPLPSSGWMLLTGLFVIAGLARVIRPVDHMGTAAA